ncbi:E3 ubiquitin-protein ligase RHA2A [Hibiscus syriacus]|uniref:E3 ubiquitin-protein ligase RHA2A n=1 Tax=Hibiscus syriacus TaxID=106335 RepID=A0A6A2Z4H0_HIBSY|nr:E3 ubiquitin-protein ligase RHA2A-like [Hibiscus syriacus]KAE8686894.1 E3 ubiquitin-protein ligase RHA2A [Hibiscus syriacus]
MGLQGRLNDVSSNSIPLLILALIAHCFAYLRNLLFDRFRFTDRTVTTEFHGTEVVGWGLASLVVLAEQLNLNKVLSYRYDCGGGVCDCVVCLCRLRDGDQVRELDCCHVFHKECFDGWLHHFYFNCPLCRSPLKIDRRVEFTRKCVGGELLDWFSLR